MNRYSRKKVVLLCAFLSTQYFTYSQEPVPESDSVATVITTESDPPPKLDHWQTAGRVWKNWVLSVPGDFSEMGKRVSENWLRTGAYTAGVGLLILADKPVTTFHQDVVEKNIDYKFPELPNVKLSKDKYLFGRHDAYLVYSLAGLYAGSFAANYSTGQRAALNSIKALGYSYLVSQLALKTIFARQRPDPTLSIKDDPVGMEYSRNPYDFFNFRAIRFGSGGYATAFPSYHATAYYAVAQVLALEFNNYWIPYGAVTLIFFADLKAHKHWVGDMVAGGLLGSVIGHGIVKGTRRLEKRQLQRQNDKTSRNKFQFNYNILPSVSPSSLGLNLYASF